MKYLSQLLSSARGVISICLLGAACCVVPQFGSIIRESDQASIFFGALQLSHDFTLSADFYQFEFQFLSYWFLIPIFSIFIENADAAIFSANLASGLVFWFAVASLLVVKVRTVWQALLCGAVILSPAILHHSPYFAPNFLSAACMIGLILVGQANNSFRLALIFLGTFSATAFRADAVLAMPLIYWLTYRDWYRPKSIFLKGLVSGVAGCLTALLVGKLIATSEGKVLYDFFIYPKLFAAYSVFGLGAVLFILPMIIFLLIRAVWMIEAPVRGWKVLDILGGLGALLLPVIFYSLQLFSTRHWVLIITVVLVILSSTRWRLLWESWHPQALSQRIKPIIILVVSLVSVLPLFIGLEAKGNLNFKPVFTNATRFPTADGLIPMGAYLDFALEYDGDHTHSLWKSMSRRYLKQYLDEDVLPVLYHGSLRSVLKFGAKASGLNYRLIELDEIKEAQHFIADDRLWRRDEVQFHLNSSDRQQQLYEFGIEQVGQDPHAGNGVIWAVKENNALSIRWNGWRNLFLGNEFRELEGLNSAYLKKKVTGGRSVAFFSEVQFLVIMNNDKENHTHSARSLPSGGYGLYFNANETVEMMSSEFQVIGKDIFAAMSYYPEFMNKNDLK